MSTTSRTYTVTVSMASHPPRKEGVASRVNELLPQLGPNDRLRLYLNNYDEEWVSSHIPKDPRLHVILAGEGRPYPDMGSQGKFWNVGKNRDGLADDGYWLVVDDDIVYPPGYVDYMVAGCQKYNNRAIVTIHGGQFNYLNNGALPTNRPCRDCRTLFEYWRERDRDFQVHTSGCGITAFHPKTIHMDDAVITGVLHSGDDEDVAVWAQKHEVPIMRLSGKCTWVNPDQHTHIISPLYSNAMSLALADEKIKKWTKWHFPSFSAPRTPAYGPNGMFDRALTEEEIAHLQKTVSSESLAALITHRLINRIPTSVIRMSDGERAAINVAEGGDTIAEFRNEAWLNRYGLMGANMKEVGANLLKAGKEADFLACSISGLYLAPYRTWPFFKDRTCFCDQFYPQLWSAMERIGSVFAVSRGGIIVLHRSADVLANRLHDKYRVYAFGMHLNSWKDHAGILRDIAKRPEGLVLVSGGASGKWLCVQIAKATGKVVLDIGEAMETVWAA